MPNLHTLAIKSQRWQNLGDEKKGRELELCDMETVDIVARAAGGRVLFPHLKTVYVDMYGYLKPLSNVAPNIESLKMSDITWLVDRPADFPDIKLPHVKFLEVGDNSAVTMRVLQELLKRLPSLQKLHHEHTDSGLYCFSGGLDDDCPTPRGIVNLLKPIAGQMKELKLSHFDRWIVRLCHEAGVSRYARKFSEPGGVLEPLEFLTVLERLDVDSDCLWVQRHPDIRRSNYEKVMHLMTLLPQRLQDLAFDGFNDDNADGDDPDPRIKYVFGDEPDDGDESMGSDEEEEDSEEYPWSVTYRFLPRSPGLAPEHLQTLKQAFGEVGIAFHPSQREAYEIEERRLRRSRWHRDDPEIEWF
ncbi:hypothetical protein CGLO_04782 [Colletotrichum gloeosporioides Cg-14]|uniref:Uncharacterized protein n=1 Tax=Colletotrichum gloeosporioides (strain Cg-14) TaxID=1237896 RepID=T0LU60_COLGC|nr:hypothetical protein CGLO_04782 [Colletotrichum gloeosporioides Cg-14]